MKRRNGTSTGVGDSRHPKQRAWQLMSTGELELYKELEKRNWDDGGATTIAEFREIVANAKARKN